MNAALSALYAKSGLADPDGEALRFAFGLACVQRVRHLLEDPRALAALDTLRGYVAGETAADTLRATAADLQQVANGHRGSNSIDGSAHAAVSATYAVANALAGRALEAASYAAYATVYAYGGYAVSDPASFEPEYAWQLGELERLLARTGAAP